VPLGQTSPCASLGFVVYRDGKARFVADLRKVNTKLYMDAYPLPKQDDILEAMGGAIRLCNAPQPGHPDFDKDWILYVDGSKEVGFGAAVHRIGPDGLEHPIFYLSKDLTPAERNYWSTDLETAALIWVLHKIPHFLDSGHITVIPITCPSWIPSKICVQSTNVQYD
jgi:hypothetical protein